MQTGIILLLMIVIMFSKHISATIYFFIHNYTQYNYKKDQFQVIT